MELVGRRNHGTAPSWSPARHLRWPSSNAAAPSACAAERGREQQYRGTLALKRDKAYE